MRESGAVEAGVERKRKEKRREKRRKMKVKKKRLRRSLSLCRCSSTLASLSLLPQNKKLTAVAFPVPFDEKACL